MFELSSKRALRK